MGLSDYRFGDNPIFSVCWLSGDKIISSRMNRSPTSHTGLNSVVDFTRLADEQIIQLVARANSDALRELYDRYSRLVYSIALNTIGNQALAEEITQDVFLRIWERAGTYRAEYGRVGSWIAGITRHRTIDVYRHRQTSPEGHSASLDALPYFDLADGQNVEQEVESNSRNALLRQALTALPGEQREALALAYFRGLSHDQIARALGEPLGTIKTRIRLGMQKLRQVLVDEDARPQ